MTVDVYLLDVPENSGILDVARRDPALAIQPVGPYFRIGAARGSIVIDRRATGCRHAVWYSAIAGIAGGRVVQLDKDAMRVEPHR